jgi:hypothetical protein
MRLGSRARCEVRGADRDDAISGRRNSRHLFTTFPHPSLQNPFTSVLDLPFPFPYPYPLPSILSLRAQPALDPPK